MVSFQVASDLGLTDRGNGASPWLSPATEERATESLIQGNETFQRSDLRPWTDSRMRRMSSWCSVQDKKRHGQIVRNMSSNGDPETAKPRQCVQVQPS